MGAARPDFEQVTIVGIGLLGASCGLATRRRGLARRVVGVARCPQTLQAALQAGAADHTTTDLPAALAGADLVVLATPVRTIIEHLGQIGPWLAPAAIVTDLGSTKRLVVAAARALPGPGRFVPGHPMAGSHRSGPAHARADLFEGVAWLLTPTPETAPAALARVEAWAAALGAHPLRLEPEQHDRLVAYTSHLPHAAAVALVQAYRQAAAREPELARLVAGGFRDTTRTAAAEATMWRDILSTNVPALRAALAELRQQLAALEGALEDPAALELLLRQAGETRRELG